MSWLTLAVVHLSPNLFYSKAHLDQYVAQVKLQIVATKIWDPYRSYEKRLTGIMQKDKSNGTFALLS